MEFALAGIALALFLMIAFRGVIKRLIDTDYESYDAAADDEFQQIITREKELMRQNPDENL